MKRILAGLALALLIASPVTAAPPLDPTLGATPNPAQAGDVVTFEGSGYPIGQVCLNIAGAMTCGFSDDGTLHNEWPYFTVAGSYAVFSYWREHGNHTEFGPTITVVVE
jgi:hypothetical protein